MPRTTKPVEVTISVTMDEDRLMEIFEEMDVKPSTAKVKKLIKLVEEVYADVQEALEEALESELQSIISDEWE